MQAQPPGRDETRLRHERNNQVTISAACTWTTSGGTGDAPVTIAADRGPLRALRLGVRR